MGSQQNNRTSLMIRLFSAWSLGLPKLGGIVIKQKGHHHDMAGPFSRTSLSQAQSP